MHSKGSLYVDLEVYNAFLFPAPKCVLSVLSLELALNSNGCLKNGTAAQAGITCKKILL